MSHQTGGIGNTRRIGGGSIPVYQGTNKDIQLAQGGFGLDKTNLPPGAILAPGTPMVFDEGTRMAAPLRSAVAQANAASNAVNYRVKKGHAIKVGDYLASGAAGGPAYAITGIDTTNAGYDQFTVGTTIGAVTAGALLYVSTATGANASALPPANGLLYEETTVFPDGVQNSVSVVIRGTVYARRIPFNAAIAALPGLDDIIFSQSH